LVWITIGVGNGEGSDRERRRHSKIVVVEHKPHGGSGGHERGGTDGSINATQFKTASRGDSLEGFAGADFVGRPKVDPNCSIVTFIRLGPYLAARSSARSGGVYNSGEEDKEGDGGEGIEDDSWVHG
jgi:hypothetical protein